MANETPKGKKVETLTHDKASRTNIPTIEYQPVMEDQEQQPVKVRYPRNVDLDPQLVWRGKDEQNWSDLVTYAPPLFIQEKVHPKVLIDDLLRNKGGGGEEKDLDESGLQTDLFADFNGLPSGVEQTDFYQHEANWSNRIILGDSLYVMASLAEREGLRGKVQCIYFDPPYGIKFNSNFQWSTTNRDVRDGNQNHITRQPEQVRAFRDTWRDGVHSYLSYLRDRLTVSRDLLADSGSIFIQIGNENMHRVRLLMDEVMGDKNFVSLIPFLKTSGKGAKFLDSVNDYLMWYAKDISALKYTQLHAPRTNKMLSNAYTWVEEKPFEIRRMTKDEINSNLPPKNRFSSQTICAQGGGENLQFPVTINGNVYYPSKNSHWKTNVDGMEKLKKAGRLFPVNNTLTYKRYAEDFPVVPITNWWSDTMQSTYATNKRYVVETYSKVIQRCILMTTEPGDLVLDPTCGSGTTAYVAEQWGRRWITIDTSRVALTLTRSRIMGARYPYYLLYDSPEGQQKESEIHNRDIAEKQTYNNVRLGFVYERIPHIMLKNIANNKDIDRIWAHYQNEMDMLRKEINIATGKSWQEWNIPLESSNTWSDDIKENHNKWWELRLARQREINISIATNSDSEILFDKPYENKKKIRVSGPFTVESISPYRILAVDENENLFDSATNDYGHPNFIEMILEHIRTHGIQQSNKEDHIQFSTIQPWPGNLVCAEALYLEGNSQKRAALFVGPEFGTVSRPDLVSATKESAESGFDILISCAFSYDANSTEFNKLGRIPVLKARMNPDLHMADRLRSTGKSNLFVIFGEPDIKIEDIQDNQIQVMVIGVDVFDPATGEVRSDNTDRIACWFVDDNYNEESFFVRQAYFLGADDPYKALKTTLKAEINQEAWKTLYSDISRPFPKPKSGRIAVKVINHLGDEVMKVFRIN